MIPETKLAEVRARLFARTTGVIPWSSEMAWDEFRTMFAALGGKARP